MRRQSEVSKPRKARENTVTKAWLVLVLRLIGWESGANFLKHSQSELKQKITFDTQLKII